MKLKRYERGVFDSFSRRGSALYEADRRGVEQYFEPKNDVPYRIRSVSIARSLTIMSFVFSPEHTRLLSATQEVEQLASYCIFEIRLLGHLS